MCTAFGTDDWQSDKQGNLYTKWCFIVINSRLHDSHALAVVFFSNKSQRLICQLSSIYEHRLNVHRKIKLRLEMKWISLDPE